MSGFDNIILPEDDNILDLTQKVRLRALKSITQDGTSIPTDKDTLNAIAKLTSDMDKQVVSKKRLMIEKEGNDIAAQANAIFLNMQDRVPQLVRQYQSGGGHVPQHNGPLLDNVTTVPGETEIGVETTTFETFTKVED